MISSSVYDLKKQHEDGKNFFITSVMRDSDMK